VTLNGLLRARSVSSEFMSVISRSSYVPGGSVFGSRSWRLPLRALLVRHQSIRAARAELNETEPVRAPGSGDAGPGGSERATDWKVRRANVGTHVWAHTGSIDGDLRHEGVITQVLRIAAATSP
jgi:hypothetical protein